MNRISIEFLVRSGCHLCEEARAGVLRAARMAGTRVEEIDIDDHDGLVRDFGLRIPVVRVNGVAVAEGRIDPVGLWFDLMRHRIGRLPGRSAGAGR